MVSRSSSVVLIFTVSIVALASADNWRCRIGVAGDFASGYAGLLARHGIPYEFVLDHQLNDEKVLAQYDAILLASLYLSRLPNAPAALERYVRSGGRVLFGTSYALTPLRGGDQVEGEPPLISWCCSQSPQTRRATVSMLPVEDVDLLSPEWRPGVPCPNLSVRNRVNGNLPGAKVLARYDKVVVKDSEKRKRLPQVAPGDPAIVRVPRGRGYYVLVGPDLGLAMGLQGVAADAPALALVRMMTDGRGTSQLTAEGVQVDRGVSINETAGAPQHPLSSVPIPLDEMRTASRPRSPAAPEPLPPGFTPLTEEPEPEFAITGVYHPQDGVAKLVTNYANARYHYAIEFAPTDVTLVAVSNGRKRTLGRAVVGSETTDAPFTVKERRDKLSVFLPGAARLQVQTDQLWRGPAAVVGSALTECRFQPLEPIYFADDFMRLPGQPGEWEVLSGSWQIKSEQKPESSANPFTWVVRSGGQAVTVAGYPFWDTYWYRVDVRPDSAGGAIGLLCYFVDANNHWLFRARVNDSPTALRDGFELVRVVDGNPEVLAKCPGALVRGQWYSLSMRMIDKWIGAFVDARKVLTVEDTHFAGGRVGLLSEGVEATFDDVQVTSAFSLENPPEVFRGLAPGYAGVIDQDTWAGPASEWSAAPERRGMFWNRGLFFGDAGLQFRGDVLLRDRVSVSLFFASAQGETGRGCRLDAVRAGDHVDFRLQAQGKPVTARIPATAQPPLFSLRRQGSDVIARIDGVDKLRLPDAIPSAEPWRIGFHVDGAKPRISAITYWSDHTDNDTFQTAPSRWWVGRGVWNHTNRWSCSPQWSWFGGVSPIRGNRYDGPAVVWSKRAYTGDQSVEYYTGPKMLPKPQGKGTLEQMRDFNLTLCGDGADVRSGYAFLVAPEGRNEARLLRQGEVVSTATFYVPQAGHNRWLHLTASRLRNLITLDFDGQRLLTYTDPDPLPGGHIGLWTDSNGIILPRVTIYYAGKDDNPLSLVLAPPVIDENADDDVGRLLAFDDSVADWVSLDDEAAVSVDTQVFKGAPAALAYEYHPREGAFPVLLSPQLKVAGAKALSLDIRCSRTTQIVFTLMESDRSRYVYLLQLPRDRWHHVDLPLSRFRLAPDSVDENRRLDADELQYFTVTDMDVVGVWQGRAKEAPARTVWLDNLQFS